MAQFFNLPNLQDSGVLGDIPNFDQIYNDINWLRNTQSTKIAEVEPKIGINVAKSAMAVNQKTIMDQQLAQMETNLDDLITSFVNNIAYAEFLPTYVNSSRNTLGEIFDFLVQKGVITDPSVIASYNAKKYIIDSTVDIWVQEKFILNSTEWTNVKTLFGTYYQNALGKTPEDGYKAFNQKVFNALYNVNSWCYSRISDCNLTIQGIQTEMDSQLVTKNGLLSDRDTLITTLVNSIDTLNNEYYDPSTTEERKVEIESEITTLNASIDTYNVEKSIIESEFADLVELSNKATQFFNLRKNMAEIFAEQILNWFKEEISNNGFTKEICMLEKMKYEALGLTNISDRLLGAYEYFEYIENVKAQYENFLKETGVEVYKLDMKVKADQKVLAALNDKLIAQQVLIDNKQIQIDDITVDLTSSQAALAALDPNDSSTWIYAATYEECVALKNEDVAVNQGLLTTYQSELTTLNEIKNSVIGAISGQSTRLADSQSAYDMVYESFQNSSYGTGSEEYLNQLYDGYLGIIISLDLNAMDARNGHKGYALLVLDAGYTPLNMTPHYLGYPTEVVDFEYNLEWIIGNASFMN